MQKNLQKGKEMKNQEKIKERERSPAMTLSIITTTLSLSGEVLSQEISGEKDVRDQDYLEAQTLLLTGQGSKELIEKFRKGKNL